MAENAEVNQKPVSSSSKIDSENDSVQYIDFDLKIRCAKTRDGKTRFCSIQDISIDEPSVDKTPLGPVLSPPKDTTVAAAPRNLSDGKETECSLCSALEAVLKEKAKASTALTVPRRMTSQVGRRTVRS